MEQPRKRTSMSVVEMGKLLGLGKTESYYLVRKNYFQVITVGNTMRVMIPGFEEWYENQSFYKKVDGPAPGSALRKTSMNAEELGDLLLNRLCIKNLAPILLVERSPIDALEDLQSVFRMDECRFNPTYD